MAPSAADRNRVKGQLATTRATLASAGIPLPWLDAEILVAHVLKSSRERLHSHPDQPLSVAQRARPHRPPPQPRAAARPPPLRPRAARRPARVPVPFLVGDPDFDGHRLKVTPAVLIPRPSSELLVELAIY